MGQPCGCSDEIERFAGFQANDGFFPFAGAAGIGTAFAAHFAFVVRGADSDDLLAENLLNRLLDLELVGAAVDFEGDFAGIEIPPELIQVFKDLAIAFGALMAAGAVLFGVIRGGVALFKLAGRIFSAAGA